MAEPTGRDREMAREAMDALRRATWFEEFLWRQYATVSSEGRREAIEECARAAEAAQLPPGYQWGHDAMEQFNFGKKRAAEAIRALVPKVGRLDFPSQIGGTECRSYRRVVVGGKYL